MIIEQDKVVSLIYELREGSAQGNVVEEMDPEYPLTFLFGHNNLLPKFEANLAGKKVGDKFEFNLVSDDAYGPINEDAVVDVPINIFHVNGELDTNMVFVGNTIPMRDNQGNRLNGLVKEIQEEVVVMDFNHPMAGKDLHFRGEVIDLREGTEEEISHGHIHAGGGCGSGCGSSCGTDSKEGGCGSGCGC